MTKTITALTIAAALLIPAPAHALKDWRPCKFEDSTNCIWDAKHQGNGKGKSFKVSPSGKITYLTHRRAHYLLNR